MDTFESFGTDLYRVNDQNFDKFSVNLFKFQARHCPVYRDYIAHLQLDPETVDTVGKIPFLPVSFFKTHLLKTGNWTEAATFYSSGTTAEQRSRHAVRDVDFYRANTTKCFYQFLGPPERYDIFSLLPSYLEREGSSLVVMMNHLIQTGGSKASGFYLHDTDRLLADIDHSLGAGRIPLLWGTSFALLDLAEQYKPDLSRCVIFETGGMKGRRPEITREDLHNQLREGFNVFHIFSEYGMTELMSQAYSGTRGTFQFPPWAGVRIRDIYDPFTHGLLNQTGALNIIDLANFQTMAFVETEDMGIAYEDGSFEVMGRMDNSDIRGCNMLIG